MYHMAYRQLKSRRQDGHNPNTWKHVNAGEGELPGVELEQWHGIKKCRLTIGKHYQSGFELQNSLPRKMVSLGDGRTSPALLRGYTV